MKKVILVLLACLLLVPCALAEGGLEITQEAFHVIEENDFDGLAYASVANYYYAKVTNTGSQPMVMDAGILTVTDSDQVVQYVGEAYDTFPHVVLPGQSAYLWASGDMLIDDLFNEGSGYEFELIDKPASDGAPLLLEVMEASYVEEPHPIFEADQIVFVTVRNPMDYPVKNPCCGFGLYAEDRLIFAGNAECFDVCIPAGQTIVIAAPLFRDVTVDQGLIPEVQAIAYAE